MEPSLITPASSFCCCLQWLIRITFLRLLGILLWSPMSFIGVLLSYNLVIIVCITAPNFYSTAHLFFLDVVNNIILWICGQIFSKPQLWFATIWTCIIEKGLTYGSNIQILELPLNFSTCGMIIVTSIQLGQGGPWMYNVSFLIPLI